MPKMIRCKDAGTDCDWVGQAETEEALLNKVVEHAKVDHGLPFFPVDMLEKAKTLIRDE